MRRIAWVFALFGATGLAARTSLSAEPSTRTRLSQAPKATASEPAAARTNGLKNYADELFGEEEEAGSVSFKSTAKKEPATKAPAKQESAARVPVTAARPRSTTSATVPPPAKDAFDTKDELDAEFARMLDASPNKQAARLTATPSGQAPKTPASNEAIQRAFGTTSEKNLWIEDSAPAGKGSIQQVGGEAAPWAKSRVSAPEIDATVPARDVRKLTPASATSEISISEAAPVARPSAARNTSFAPRTPSTASKLTTPIDIDAAGPAAPASPSEVAPVRKPGVSFTRTTPLPERSRTPAATGTAASAMRSTVAVTPKAAEATAAPSVTVAWRTAGSLNIGQECTCELVVKNDGSVAAADVDVEASFPKNVRLVSAEPKPTTQTGFLGWKMPTLAAGEEKVIVVKLVPLERGQIETDARVRFSGTARNSFTVAEPLLSVKVDGPKQVMIGDPAPHTVLITNPGTGIATNVKIEAMIPKGLEHVRGERLVMDLGSLNPGETRNIRLACAAVSGGSHKLQVRAIADADLAEAASSEVAVIAPQLKATIDGPGLRYLGRQATFSLSVANDGSVATDNVRVMHKIPDGFDFVSGGRGATYDAGNRLLSWYVGHLDQGQKSNLEITLVAANSGEHTHFIRATSDSGAVSDAQFSARVEGSPALVLSIRDLDDPVEVGVETAYEIKVKNEGSAAATNVGMTLELPEGLQFLSATGPTEFAAEKDSIVFRPVGDIGPGKTCTYMVKVKGRVTGNARLRSRLTSESIAEPIVADELTKFYE